MKMKRIKKTLRISASYLLSAIQVTSDGLSSARQIVDFTPEAWAKYASCGGSIVEGEIYRKNIDEGFSKLSLLSKESFWKYLIIQKFETNLEIIERCEKDLRKDLHSFLTTIQVNPERLIDLNDQIALFEQDTPLTGKKLADLITCFNKLEKVNNGTSTYIVNTDIEQFKILQEQFVALIKEKEDRDCAFLISYKANQTFLAKAKSLDRKLSDNEKEVIEQAEIRLKILRKSLVENVPLKKESTLTDISPILLKQLEKEFSAAKIKLWLLRFGMLFSLLVATAVGVFTFYTFPATLISLGLLTSTTVLSAIVWPLAIFTAIAYGILIYNTITDLIINETLTQWWKNIKQEAAQSNDKQHLLKYLSLIAWKTLSKFFSKIIDWFKRKPKESCFSYGLRIVLSLAVISFGIIAALTTGYTAFTQLQKCVTLAVCVITALPLFLGDLLFILKNSFDSIALLIGISFSNLFNPIKAWWKKLKAQLQTENYLQLALHLVRLPLMFLLSVFKLSVFLYHIIFSSVASDRFFNFSFALTVFFAAGSELLTDICPLFGKAEGEEHDHDHGGIFNWLAKLIFIVPTTLLGVFNWLLSQLNRFSSNPTLKVLTFSEAILKEWHQFDIRHIHPEESNVNEVLAIGKETQLPREIALGKAIEICNKQIKRLGDGVFKSKAEKNKTLIFTKCKEKLDVASQNRTEIKSIEELINPSEKNILAKHRHLTFFTKQTTSERKLDKIKNLVINDNTRQAGQTLCAA
ncbi:MAG: hypothetical protein V4700_06860 [Pseudomonadota bacterium]